MQVCALFFKKGFHLNLEQNSERLSKTFRIALFNLMLMSYSLLNTMFRCFVKVYQDIVIGSILIDKYFIIIKHCLFNIYIKLNCNTISFVILHSCFFVCTIGVHKQINYRVLKRITQIVCFLKLYRQNQSGYLKSVHPLLQSESKNKYLEMVCSHQ